MATIEIGPLRVIVPPAGQKRLEEKLMSGSEVEGTMRYALVSGPDGLELDLEYFSSDQGEGWVRITDIHGAPQHYKRLQQGARLGVYSTQEGHGLVKQLRLYRPDIENSWGQVSMTTVAELDGVLGTSVEELLRDLGATRVGTAKEVLPTGEGKTSDVVFTWGESAAPELVFTAYALTRPLPLFLALEEVQS